MLLQNPKSCLLIVNKKPLTPGGGVKGLLPKGVAGVSNGVEVHPRTELVELRPQGVSSPSHGLRAAAWRARL